MPELVTAHEQTPASLVAPIGHDDCPASNCPNAENIEVEYKCDYICAPVWPGEPLLRISGPWKYFICCPDCNFVQHSTELEIDERTVAGCYCQAHASQVAPARSSTGTAFPMGYNLVLETIDI